MHKQILFTFAVSSTLFATTVCYSDQVQFGVPSYAGTGCPAGSASLVLSPDHTTLSMSFDDYQAEAGKTTGARIVRKSCNLSIPVHVPKKMQFALSVSGLNGFVSAPKDTQARVDYSHSFLGNKGYSIAKDFKTPIDSEFEIADDLIAHNLIWSQCGTDVNLRFNTSLTVATNSKKDDVLILIGNASASALTAQILWRACN